MSRESDDTIFSENRSDGLGRQIALSEMYSHSARAENEVTPVVDDQCYSLRAGELDTLLQVMQELFNRSGFIPYLNKLSSAALQFFQNADMACHAGQFFVCNWVDRRERKYHWIASSESLSKSVSSFCRIDSDTDSDPEVSG